LQPVVDATFMRSLIKVVYRAIVPTAVRASARVARLKARLLPHNWIYDSEFYEKSVEGAAVRGAAKMAAAIIDDLKATSVIDVGCGTGALLAALRDRGCQVYGLEYAEAALAYCRLRRLDVAKFDLENDDFTEGRVFDVAVSMEVAEHLPQKAADRYIDLLTRLSPIVVFTAAPPGQGGTDHVNEQPSSYWIARFRDHGFDLAVELSQRLRDRWKAAGDIEDWYHRNLMIFRRRAAN
jgi:SAM-dependent methyltransferase